MVMTMSTVTVMHEDMHQRAGQQQQIRQRTEEVGAVFGQQKVRGDGAENYQTDAISGAPERWFGCLSGGVVHFK